MARIRWRIGLVLATVLTLSAPAGVTAHDGLRGELSVGERQQLLRYARDTWRSFAAMVDPGTGLPADNIDADLEPASRSRYTSPTNIGSYIWSTLAARDLGIITPAEARERVAKALASAVKLERHEPSGQFYNWYDPVTLAKLTVWPTNGDPVYPFLSSVDNGWFAASLMMIERAIPQLRDEAATILADMDFSCYYDPNARSWQGFPAGLIRGGFWPETPPWGPWLPKGNYCGKGPDVTFTGHHYGAFNTEPRIASYVGIVLGQIPPEHYFAGWRTFDPTCDWSWQEMQPVGEVRTYEVSGKMLPVFEGAYTYRGMRIVPSWGGSMFEALMPTLLVPEEEWGSRSWGINHPLYVRAHIEHGLEEAGYGYWGFSPASDPTVAGGYREYGVDPLGLWDGGYTSDVERTTVDYGFGECRPPLPQPASYGQGVVTPHAAFLALPYAPHEALENLANIEADFAAYGDGGFHDSINVATGQTAARHLSLDQGMIMAAIGNALRNDRIRDYFSQGAVEGSLRPLMAMEVFGAGPAD